MAFFSPGSHSLRVSVVKLGDKKANVERQQECAAHESSAASRRKKVGRCK